MDIRDVLEPTRHPPESDEQLLGRLRAGDREVFGTLVRRYELGYSAGLHPSLATVELVGRDGTSRMPAARFSYTAMETSGEVPTFVDMEAPPGRSPRSPGAALADVNGDALPDLLVGTAGEYRYYPNHDGASWLPPVTFASARSPSAPYASAIFTKSGKCFMPTSE